VGCSRDCVLESLPHLELGGDIERGVFVEDNDFRIRDQRLPPLAANFHRKPE